MLTNGEVPAEHTAQEVYRRHFDFLDNRGMCQAFAQEELFCLIAVTEQAVMPDFHKATRQNMHEEAAYELKSGKSHYFPSVVILVVAPFEGYATILNTEDTVIGDSNAVRVTSEVLDDTGGRFEGRFAVDDPFLLIARVQQVEKMVWLV